MTTPYNPYGPPKKSPAPKPPPSPAPSLPSGGSTSRYPPGITPPKPRPGTTRRETLYPYNKLVYFKDSVYDGLVMTSGILLATFLIRQIKKDMAPQLTIVTILSDYLIDYGKRYEYIPYRIM